jgi:hypothetical protein
LAKFDRSYFSMGKDMIPGAKTLLILQSLLEAAVNMPGRKMSSLFTFVLFGS